MGLPSPTRMNFIYLTNRRVCYVFQPLKTCSSVLLLFIVSECSRHFFSGEAETRDLSFNWAICGGSWRSPRLFLHAYTEAKGRITSDLLMMNSFRNQMRIVEVKAVSKVCKHRPTNRQEIEVVQ